MSTILFALGFVAGIAIESFLPGCSCVPPFPIASRVDVLTSSARMVSSFDSTPARKEPHLDVVFDAVDGGDAMSVPDLRMLRCLLDQTHDEELQGIGIKASMGRQVLTFHGRFHMPRESGIYSYFIL